MAGSAVSFVFGVFMVPQCVRRSRAFTLVELLVVIGIIALLIAILLPTLSAAQAHSRQVVCMSNLRQIALATYNYSIDNQGLVVPTTTMGLPAGIDTIDGVTGTARMSWSFLQVQPPGMADPLYSWSRGYLGKYLGKIDVLLCPSLGSQKLATENIQTSYGMALIGAKKFSQFSDASQTALCGDAVSFSSSGILKSPLQLQRPGLGNPYDTFHGRHRKGKGNIGFADGHVRAVEAQVRPRNTYSGISTAQYNLLVVNRIGPAAPAKIDFSGISSSSQYLEECLSTHDYYFWYNKEAKR